MRAIREGMGKTQVEVAAKTGMDQAEISRLEARTDFEDSQVSTLQRYVKALGGELQLVAAFGDRRIILAGSHPSAVDDSTTKNKTRKRP
jgi:transcriptional regulator with XRE-family HTH domain